MTESHFSQPAESPAHVARWSLRISSARGISPPVHWDGTSPGQVFQGKTARTLAPAPDWADVNCRPPHDTDWTRTVRAPPPTCRLSDFMGLPRDDRRGDGVEIGA